MNIPVNSEFPSSKSKIARYKKDSEVLKVGNRNEDFIHFFENCQMKLDEFLKYNSIVDMTYYMGNIIFEEWKFNMQREEYNSRRNEIGNYYFIIYLFCY